MTDLCSGILQPRTVRNRSFTTLWRKAPGFWREHTASLALNPGMLQIMRFKIWHLYVQKSYHIMVLLALILDNLHNSLMALWVMQLSEAYIYTPLVTTLQHYIFSRYMLVHKSHISGKNKNILRYYLVISTTWKRNRVIHILRVMCYVNHLKKVPRGVKKLIHRAPCTQHTKRNTTSKSFLVKHRS